jgi:hypothetical protein
MSGEDPPETAVENLNHSQECLPVTPAGEAPGVPVDAVMAELQARVRGRLREELTRHGASASLADAALFAEVERLLRAAVDRAGPRALLMPELLGDPATWRLDTAMRYSSHRGPGAAAALVFIKQRVLMPVLRWLFEYSRDNFARQQRVNHVLFACVQELAIENAELRRQLHRLASSGGATSLTPAPEPGERVEDR